MTAQEILEAAYNKDRKLTPGRTLDDATEGVRLVARVMRKFFSIAARVNPLHYGVRAELAATNPAGGWQLPADAESIYYLEDAAGQEVIVVPFDQKDADTTRPAVLYRGKAFWSAGNAGDPVPGQTVLLGSYSKSPADPAGLAQSVDPSWDSAYDELPILEVACSMVAKEGRHEQAAALRQERDEWLRLYIAHLEHVNPLEERRRALRRSFFAHSQVPLDKLLAGGSEVAL